MARYWVGDNGTWDDTAHWSASSGGGGGASVPTKTDDVIFDANSFSSDGRTITFPLSPTKSICQTLDMSGITFTVSFAVGVSSNGLWIYNGTTTLSSKLTVSASMVWELGIASLSDLSNASYSINFNGASFTGSTFGIEIYVNNGATVNLSSDVTLPTFEVIAFTGNNLTGTFNTNNYTISCENFIPQNNFDLTSPLILNLGTSTLNVSTEFFGSSSSLRSNATLNGENSTLNMASSASTDQVSFGVYSGSLGVINISGGGTTRMRGTATKSAISLVVTDVSTIEFESGSTFTFDSITANGSVGNLITFKSITSGSRATLSSNLTYISYVDVKDNNADGSIPFDDCPGGVDSGNNLDWVFCGTPRQVQIF